MNFLKLTLIAIFSFVAISLSAQDAVEIEKRSEIKINAFYLVLGALEINYEHIINEESSFGIAATYVFEDSEYEYGIVPHYRLFFGKQPAIGFFVEGNAALFRNEYRDFVFDPNGGFSRSLEVGRTSFGLGLAVGGKFKTSRDVVVEVYGGLGRILSDDSFAGAYPRAGINIGKRF